MYRTSGLVALAIGALAALLLLFVPFNAEVGRWTRTDDGGWVRATIECPSAWGRLAGDEEPDVKYVFEAQACDRGAKGRVVETLIVLAFALPLGIQGVLRGPRPPLVHIRPLSELIRHRQP